MSTGKYDKDQFEKYLKGQMSNEEAHAFEREVLKDPFAQEALEGLENQNSEEVFRDLEELKIDTDQAKKGGFSLMRIAAVVSLLMVSSLVVWLVMDPLAAEEPIAMDSEMAEEKSPEEEIAKEQQDFAKADSLVEEQEVDNASASIASTDKIEEADQAANTVATVEEPIAEGTEDETLAEATTAGIADEDESAKGAGFAEEENVVALQTDDADDIEEDSFAVTPQEVSNSTQVQPLVAKKAEAEIELKRDQTTAPARARARSTFIADPAARTISGNVTDDSGEALPGVNVVVKGSTVGTVTDLDGNYTLQVNDGATLTYSFIGFESLELETDGNDNLDVQLGGVTELSEVVVTGYGAEGPTNETYIPAKPDEGNSSYKKYITDNLVYPPQALENEVKGTVVLELSISPSGQITNIDVKKSLGFGCDEEAIRLVREGPKWTPASRNGIGEEDKARVRVRFRN